MSVPENKDQEGTKAQKKIAQEFGRKKAADYLEPSITLANKAITAEEESIRSDEQEEETNITITEIIRELKRTQNNKATGPDNVSYEHIKYANKLVFTALGILFNYFWQAGTIPRKLKESYLTILYKKGARDDVKDFRPIQLMSCLLKIFEKCLETRLKDRLRITGEIHHLQGIGHESSGTTEMAIAATEVIQFCRERKQKVIVTALDLSKGYDRVPRELLWKSLLDCGINGKLWRALKATYEDVDIKNKIQGSISEESFRFTGGIKQGSPLSPLLYIVYMKRLLIELEKTKTGPKIGNLHIPALGYMDDLLLMATSTKEMEIQADCIKRVSLECVFVINSGKTQIAKASNQKKTLAAARNKRS